MIHTAPAPAYVSYVITAAVVCLVLFLRMRSMGRVRRLRPGMLWLVPALYAVIAATVLYQSPPVGLQWVWLAIAISGGAAIGWRRGAMMRISVDPTTGMLNQQASPAAMLILLVLIVIRQGLRIEAGAMGFNAAFMTDVLVIFALGLFAATRAEMFLRARRLLAAGRSAPSAVLP
jgi:hypothetical protein